MIQKACAPPARVPAEKLVRDIRHAARKHHSAEEKIRIVLEGLRGEESTRPCAAAKPSPRACITPGQRNFSKPINTVWPVTRPARPKASSAWRSPPPAYEAAWPPTLHDVLP
jgi:transposase